MISYRRLAIWGVFLVFGTVLTSSRVAAQVDPWEFEVYPYLTEPRGTLEVESLNSYVAAGHRTPGLGTSSGIYPSQGIAYNALEFTYGLTDRIEAAAYIDLAKPDGVDYRIAGGKFRLRGQFFDQSALPVDLGWYAEFEEHVIPAFDQQRYEIEVRPIIEKDIGRFSLQINPIFEKAILGGPEAANAPGFGYAVGAYYRWKPELSPGLEAYGGAGQISNFTPINQEQHYLFSVVWGELRNGLEYNFGVGFGLTPGSDHVIVKFNLGLERFIGTLFGASSADGWLF